MESNLRCRFCHEPKEAHISGAIEGILICPKSVFAPATNDVDITKSGEQPMPAREVSTK